VTTARIGVVLAGGVATRMGGDKVGAFLGSETLLARAVAQAREAGLEPRVCARELTRLPPIDGLGDNAIWREPTRDSCPEDAHPLAGLAYALEQAGESVVALPVDLPLLPSIALTRLADHSAAVAVVGVGGRPAALVCKVGPTLIEPLTRAARDGRPALRTLIDLGAAVVDLPELIGEAAAARALTNVNTPAELARLNHDGG
jgi:molybdopterin-guanine dinucleotide biosynthesis protein A